MKLPVELPGDTCWLMLSIDAGVLDAATSVARGWRLSARMPGAMQTMETGLADAPLAAIRLLGEAPQRLSTAQWCAAIDPVTLAADMRDVRIQAWPQRSLDAVAAAQLQSAVEALLRDDEDARLRRLRLVSVSPYYWYLVGEAGAALDFSATAPMRLPGEPLRHHRHAGSDGALLRRLATEIQMVLHSHPVNAARENAGTSPVNGVWIWGGGMLPTVTQVALPPLLTDDPLWRGYWRLLGREARVKPLAGGACALGGCVAADASSQMADSLIRTAFGDPSLATVVVGFGNETRIYQRRGLIARALAALGGGRR